MQRLYRALLRLLPFEFRAEFGRAMQSTFDEEREDVKARRSRAETLRFWLRIAKDFARTAPRQHWDVLRQDAGGGVRLLARNPGFAATAIVTLALGIGGSTSIFSVVYAVVLRPLAFPQSERVARIGWVSGGGNAATGLRMVSYTDYQTLREKSKGFDAIGVTHHDSLSYEKRSLSVKVPSTVPIGGIGESFLTPLMASASIFKLFGLSTVLGRLPDEQDEHPGAAPVAVLSHGTWTSVFGRDPAVLGRTLARHYGGRQTKPVTIVGVLAPRTFDYPSSDVPVWATIDPDVLRERGAKGKEFYLLSVYARLAPGSTWDMVRDELLSLTPHLAPGLPEGFDVAKPSLQAVRVRDLLVGRVRTPMFAFLGAVSCLLLVASVNVASLVLARALSRRQEFAARFALGARPLRVARQLFTESAVLAIAAGALGLGLAWAIRRAFVAISPAMPRLEESQLGAPAVVFTLVAVLIATCVVGIVPAIQSSRRSVVDGLRRAGGPRETVTGFSKPLATLVAAEVAVVLVLLAETGLLVNSFARMALFDLGFDSRSTIMVTVERPMKPSAPPGPAPRSRDQELVAQLSDGQRMLRSVDDDVLRRVSEIPGVSAVGLTGDDPFGPPHRYSVDIEIGEASAGATAAMRIASPTALDALRMHMIAGRWFTPDDREGTTEVAVVNETMVRRFWNGRSPLGERVDVNRRTRQVVGVVADIRAGARQDAVATVYLSSAQLPPTPAAMLVVRPQPGVRGLEKVIAAELTQFGDRIVAHSPRRLEDVWWWQLSGARFLTLVLSVFTGLGLTIALVGVSGVLRFLVMQRTRELGIRKALGATHFDLLALVMGQALRFAAPGWALGLLGAVVAGPALRSLLFGITPTDPATLIAVTVVLLAAVVVGAYFPARRAGAVDAALSLRSE
jgi:putative ABC transport system permease protein